MANRRRRAEPLVKTYIVFGTFNNRYQFVIGQCSSQAEANDVAHRALRVHNRRTGRGARLKTFIFKQVIEVQ